MVIITGDWITLLMCCVSRESNFKVIHDLQVFGRISNRVELKPKEVLTSAVGMLTNRWIGLIDLISHVPSEHTPGVSYSVWPAECFCNHPVGVRERVCKHLTLLGLLTQHGSQKHTRLLEARSKVLNTFCRPCMVFVLTFAPMQKQ